MADDHDHHGHPKPPDTRGLWLDEGWRTVAHDAARLWFWVTIIGVILYIGAVIFWIFL